MKSVLITGGSGSFGQAFVTRALAVGFERVCVLSRGEHRQAEMRERVGGDKRLRYFIGDVRDRDRLSRAFDGVEVVIHAAALKRVEVGTYEPLEMVKTNVNGTINVVEAALDAKVKRVIGISSDKAQAPKNPYGCSKAMAEAILLAANNMRGSAGPTFAVVRYGNLWGSQGSVVPKWRQMVAQGATVVPVKDPDSTRFYQRIEDAVDIAMNMALGIDEREFVVPLGPSLSAYRIGDLAEAFGVGMNIVGMPPWEKKHEAMSEDVSSDTVPRLSVQELREALLAA